MVALDAAAKGVVQGAAALGAAGTAEVVLAGYEQ